LDNTGQILCPSGIYPSKNTLQVPVCLLILWLSIFLEKPDLKCNPMRQELDHSPKAPAKVLLKLAVFGFVLIGFAYISLIIMGTALKAIH
jgi:hypothetical protein